MVSACEVVGALYGRRSSADGADVYSSQSQHGEREEAVFIWPRRPTLYLWQLKLDEAHDVQPLPVSLDGHVPQERDVVELELLEVLHVARVVLVEAVCGEDDSCRGCRREGSPS